MKQKIKKRRIAPYIIALSYIILILAFLIIYYHDRAVCDIKDFIFGKYYHPSQKCQAILATRALNGNLKSDRRLLYFYDGYFRYNICISEANLTKMDENEILFLKQNVKKYISKPFCNDNEAILKWYSECANNQSSEICKEYLKLEPEINLKYIERLYDKIEQNNY